MPLLPRQRLQYLVERLLVRGAHYRMLFAAALVGLVSVGAGTLVMHADGGFERWTDAVWWAFLRLTDPGYLGDDVGVVRRVTSLSVTIMGCVVFLGSLVAIMTQWLTQTLRNLERGFTPVVRKDHVLVLGWTNRTPSILRELLLSHGRARRFLRRVGARRLVIVVLADDVDAAMVQSLKDSLGELYNSSDLILRSGSALQVEHLARVAFAQAASVIVPGADLTRGGLDNSDAKIIKTILTISHYGRQQQIDELPWLVGEVFDDRKLHLAREAYGGEIEILSSHRFVARLMAQVVRHAGVFRVFEELLIRGDGNEVFIRPCREFIGRSFAELVEAYPHAVLLGFVRPRGASFEPQLNPSDDVLVDAETRAVLLGRTFEETDSSTDKALVALPRQPRSRSQQSVASTRRVLVLGWNHKASDFLGELGSYGGERFDVHVLSVQPIADRDEDVRNHSVDLANLQLTQHYGDFTLKEHLLALQPETFDNVVILATDLLDKGDESDARSATGYLLLSKVLKDVPQPPRVLVEVLESGNAALLGGDSDLLVSPLVVSHMLAQVSLRRELRAVCDELFGAGGAEIVAESAALYLEGDEAATFAQLQRRALLRGEVAMGVATSAGETIINPPLEQSWGVGEVRELIVLVTS